MSNKEKILSAALELFNEYGFANVRLLHISDASLVSLGNMAYHFPNKQAILYALYEKVSLEQHQLLRELNIIPLFEYIDVHLDNIFQTQLRFGFFYIDILEIIRSNEQIGRQYRQLLNWEKQQYCQCIAFNIARGVFKYMKKTEVDTLVEHLVVLKNTWLGRQLILGQNIGSKEINRFKDYIWGVFIPHFTSLGDAEFAQMSELLIAKTKNQANV